MGSIIKKKWGESKISRWTFRPKPVEGQTIGNVLGLYMLKIEAKHYILVTVFNGWFKYSNLTIEESEFITNNLHLFVNYQ